jgi:hypothetical protein
MYEVSRGGAVRNAETYHVMAEEHMHDGYIRVHLHRRYERPEWPGGGVTSESCKPRIHRLVATAFCHKPDGRDYVDHIDGNRKNNKAANLRWVTASENAIARSKRNKEKKTVKIRKIMSQHRRDFEAIFECEGCGHTELLRGYDDANFHQNAIPKMICEKCGKTSAECGADYRPLTTKYPEGHQI